MVLDVLCVVRTVDSFSLAEHFLVPQKKEGCRAGKHGRADGKGGETKESYRAE